MRKKILTVLGAAARNLLREIRHDAGAALDAARHLRPRPGLPDRGDRSRHHIDERPSDLLDIRSNAAAEERSGRKVERELLHRRIEQHLPWLFSPLRHTFRNAGIERGKV